ncbi:isochorismate synthase [bacterium]|nr:isochorismate synthase [bacterium]
MFSSPANPLTNLTLKANPILRARVGNLKVSDPWLLLDTAPHVIYWQSRNSDELWCGVGESYGDPLLSTALRVQESIEGVEDLPFKPRCFGMTRFHPYGPTASDWEGFPLRGFWIPRLQIRYRGTERDVIIIEDKHHISDPEIDFLPIPDPMFEKTSPNSLVEERSNLSRDDWRTAVRTIQSRIESGVLEKTVLARQLELTAEKRISAAAVMQRLAQSSPESYLFAYRHPRSGIFFGASPERLFHLKDQTVSVDSLAGTRPRNTGAQTDQELAHELVLSDKDKKEQRFVTDYVLEKLTPLCSDLKVSDLQVKNLATVQHLYNSITGTLLSPTDHSAAAEAILERLHPTPAICGVPTEAARELIEELEPNPRGLYAGALGMADNRSAEFAVAIRSGLLRDNRAILFAGAGIVAASVADEEFTECDWKFAALRQALFSEA